MPLNKKQRAALREKFGGRCAYCGEPLGERWHADHIEALVRNDWFKRCGFSTPNAPPSYPERDTVENMNPACAPCNIDKHSMTLENWRQIIAGSNAVLRRDVSTFRRAVRYGLIAQVEKPVVFFFETLTPPASPSTEEPA